MLEKKFSVSVSTDTITGCALSKDKVYNELDTSMAKP